MQNAPVGTAPGAVVLFSGGQDSTTCLFWALQQFAPVHAISFDYGQRHAVELQQASYIARLAGVPHQVLSLEALQQLGGSSLTDSTLAVAEGLKPANPLPNTFVPGRNLLFFTLAAAYGWQRGIHNLVGGMSQVDYSGYPDCREDFIQALAPTLSLAMDSPFRLHTPLMHLDKAGVWRLAESLGCLEIVVQHSHTCYNAQRNHLHSWGYGCGRCAACMLRQQGYEAAFGHS